MPSVCLYTASCRHVCQRDCRRAIYAAVLCLRLPFAQEHLLLMSRAVSVLSDRIYSPCPYRLPDVCLGVVVFARVMPATMRNVYECRGAMAERDAARLYEGDAQRFRGAASATKARDTFETY